MCTDNIDNSITIIITTIIAITIVSRHMHTYLLILTQYIHVTYILRSGTLFTVLLTSRRRVQHPPAPPPELPIALGHTISTALSTNWSASADVKCRCSPSRRRVANMKDSGK